MKLMPGSLMRSRKDGPLEPFRRFHRLFSEPFTTDLLLMNLKELKAAKDRLICTMVMSVTAPDEGKSLDLVEKTEQQLDHFGIYYKAKVQRECQKKAEKLLKGEQEDFQKFFDVAFAE